MTVRTFDANETYTNNMNAEIWNCPVTFNSTSTTAGAQTFTSSVTATGTVALNGATSIGPAGSLTLNIGTQMSSLNVVNPTTTTLQNIKQANTSILINQNNTGSPVAGQIPLLQFTVKPYGTLTSTTIAYTGGGKCVFAALPAFPGYPQVLSTYDATNNNWLITDPGLYFVNFAVTSGTAIASAGYASLTINVTLVANTIGTAIATGNIPPGATGGEVTGIFYADGVNNLLNIAQLSSGTTAFSGIVKIMKLS